MYTDGIILDVDGTLWNSTGIVADAWTRAVQENGCEGRVVRAEELQALFGRPMDEIMDNLLPELPPTQRYEIMKVCCAYEHQALIEELPTPSQPYEEAMPECLICYPGVQPVIRRLSKHIPVFIVSNCQKGYIELFLEKTGLAPYITDFECFGNTGKSKGENIRLVVERNRLSAPVYVGDTKGDATASEQAGVPFVYAAYGFGATQRAAAKIESFGQLEALLDCREKEREEER